MVKHRTLHRVGAYRITFGSVGDDIEFRIVDQGGGYITGLVNGTNFVDAEYGSSGPNSEPVFTPQRREALGRALEERNAGGGLILDDREEG
jgi:hypothetical protein